MPKYKISWLQEVKRFEKCCDSPSIPQTEVGLEQFYHKESRGIEPISPYPYYTRLLNGKKWWE